jgi:tetratricopeptide (TPR) repeat protein
LMGRARALLAKGDAAGAMVMLETFLRAEPKVSGYVWLDLGDLAMQVNKKEDHAKARSAYMKAAQLLSSPSELPSRVKALVWAGVAHRRDNQHADALVLITRALQLDPDNQDGHLHAALAYSGLNDMVNSLKHYMWLVRFERPMRLCSRYQSIAEHLCAVRLWDLALRWVQQAVDMCRPEESGDLLELLVMGSVCAAKLDRAELVDGFESKGAKLRNDQVFRDKRVQLNERICLSSVIYRQGFGRNESAWRAHLLPILTQPDEHPPRPDVYELDWPTLCIAAAHSVRPAVGCYDKLDAFLLRSRSAFLSDHGVEFRNPLLNPLECLVSPHLTAADCRWASVVSSSRLSAGAVAAQLNPDDYPLLAAGAKLELGLFAADWSLGHPMQRLIMAFLRSYPRHAVRLTLFYRGVSGTSPVLQAAAALVDEAVSLSGVAAQDAAILIRHRSLHAMIDCAGATGDGMPDLMVLKAAPIMAGWAGFPGTSGSPAIDYIIADRWTVPPELRANTLTEHAIYIAGSWLFTDHIAHYGANPEFFDPSSRNNLALRAQVRAEFGIGPDQIVYGSFNRPLKLDPHMMSAVCEVMRRVPNSVFLQVAFDMASSAVPQLERIWQEDCGLPRARLVLLPLFKSGKHLQVAALALDVALDSPLYNGGLTSADMLFAGVPIVTLSGALHKWTQRMAGSIVRAAGLPELVAADWEDYIAIAARLALDREHYARIRVRLFRAFSGSPLASQVLFQPQV